MEDDRENLIEILRYHYFSLSCKSFRVECTSYAEMRNDEEPADILDSILSVLRCAHRRFFELVSLIFRCLSLTILCILNYYLILSYFVGRKQDRGNSQMQPDLSKYTRENQRRGIEGCQVHSG